MLASFVFLVYIVVMYFIGNTILYLTVVICYALLIILASWVYEIIPILTQTGFFGQNRVPTAREKSGNF